MRYGKLSGGKVAFGAAGGVKKDVQGSRVWGGGSVRNKEEGRRAKGVGRTEQKSAKVNS